jgi:hypothetical protein
MFPSAMVIARELTQRRKLCTPSSPLWPRGQDVLFIRDELSNTLFTVPAAPRNSVMGVVMTIRGTLQNMQILTGDQRLWWKDVDLLQWPNATLETLGVPAQVSLVIK